MFTLKKFPIKELIGKLFSILILIISFKIVSTTMGTKKNLILVSNNTQSVNKKNSIPTKNKLILLEKKLNLVEKFDARVEEQAFLLSLTKKEATKKKIAHLVDQPQIQEIQNKIRSYKQALKN